MLNLKQLREKAKLTQIQLAKLTGYCRRSIQRHESGETKMKPHHIAHYKLKVKQ